MSIQSALGRHQRFIDTALREVLDEVVTGTEDTDLASFYGQMRYHLGWVDVDFAPIQNNPGKLLRPTLLLLAYEAAGAWRLAEEGRPASVYMKRALPAAVAVELTHNFTLIHDDIEDGDPERRHRATLWKQWGVPQAINTGDGMFALSRLSLWKLLDHGVEAGVAIRLANLLDKTILTIAEGQHLDISFEGQQHISVAMYLDMIRRKTGVLMECAAEMGALLGTQEVETIQRLREFGWAIGAAFQLRDDLLGIWASSAELGKTPAGDIYRRKKSLPILHALEQAEPEEQEQLRAIYQQQVPITAEQVEQVLTIFGHTRTREYCRAFLQEHCTAAHEALASVPVQNNEVSARALADLEALVYFIEEAAKE